MESSIGNGCPLRIALIVNSECATAHAIRTLPGEPVGLIRWHRPIHGPTVRQHVSDASTRLARFMLQRTGHRRYRSLEHLAACSGLHYLDCPSTDPQRLAETLMSWSIDLAIVSGAEILPMQALAGLSAGAINLHPAPLPAYRGANPLFWQIAAGESAIGATVHRIDAGIDTGPVLASGRIERPVAIHSERLWWHVEERLGVPLLIEAIGRLQRGADGATVQPVLSPTPYARRITVTDVADALPLSTLGYKTVRDLIAYLGVCPPGWLGLKGWRTHCHWRLQSHTSNADALCPDDAPVWQVRPHRLRIRLCHRDGRLELAPVSLALDELQRAFGRR